MRTDTERLDYLLAIIEAQDDDAAEKLSAAHTLGLKGRPMVDAAMGAKLVEPGEPMPELTALDLAVAELGRIRNVKGFSEERDDEYPEDELACAAAQYVLPEDRRPDSDGELWPWKYPFKPSPDDRKRELTKGIALALCELDRLIRAERRGIEEHQNSPEHRAYVDALCEPGVAPREFKVGDRVSYPNYDDKTRQLGEYRGKDFAGYAQVAVAGGTVLLFPYSELERVDG